MMSPKTAAQAAAGIAEALPLFKDKTQAREASYMRAIAAIVDNRATPEAALPVVDESIRKVRTLWGKVYHTWVSGSNSPEGPAGLFRSVTGVDPLVLPAGVKLPPVLVPTATQARP